LINFTVIDGKASLNAPAGTIYATSPAYSWKPVTSATAYHIRLINSSTGAVLFDTNLTPDEVGCSGGSGTWSYAPATSLGVGTYRWSLQAKNDSGFAAWNSLSFTVSLPAPPTVVSPLGTVTTTTNPVYSWKPVAGATHYQIAVNSATAQVGAKQFTAEQANCASGTCSASLGVTLPNGSYTWRVRAKNEAGYGGWTAARAFNVTLLPPTAPRGISPSRTAVATATPTFKWYAIDGDVIRYQIMLSGPSGVIASKAFLASSGICSGSTCSASWGTSLTSGTTYTWQVRAQNTAGYGSWNTPTQFTVE